MKKFKFELGEGLKDVVTGFTGVVMARVEYLTGCDQYALSTTNLGKEGKRPDWEYFDENRLVKSGKSIKLPEEKDTKEKKVVRGFDGTHSSRE